MSLDTSRRARGLRKVEGPSAEGAVVRTLTGMDWTTHLGAWTAAMRAADLREQTIELRLYQIRRAAREVRVPLERVTTEHLEAWLAAHAWSRASRRSYRAALRAWFAWTTRTGRTTSDPARDLPSPGLEAPAPRPTPEAAYRRAIMTADERTRLMVRLAADLGLRRGEVAAVHAHDVVEDLMGYSLVVHGKGGRRRVVPLPDDLARQVLARARGGFAFPGAVDGHLSARWVGRLVGDLLPEGVTMHSLRHRFATRVYAVDQDLLSTQQLLGHASPVTTQAYVQVPDEARRRLVLAIAS
ncbi:tyrosine-type recombinase/integrase [Sanguibacter massiliensis]|uniref:tyrosine-type recombinase/integrase n=1 Tax=Sanguibacter massiliensis TaxID=1973217 RepID=UPI001A92DE63|nr:tyrosine-type recombinase/integrase [Sanguibacter massiliensis]